MESHRRGDEGYGTTYAKSRASLRSTTEGERSRSLEGEGAARAAAEGLGAPRDRPEGEVGEDV